MKQSIEEAAKKLRNQLNYVCYDEDVAGKFALVWAAYFDLEAALSQSEAEQKKPINQEPLSADIHKIRIALTKQFGEQKADAIDRMLLDLELKYDELLDCYPPVKAEDKLREAFEWKNVKDALPELDTSVLVSEKGIVFSAYYWSYCGEVCFMCHDEIVNPTHWMPRPSAPKAGLPLPDKK